MFWYEVRVMFVLAIAAFTLWCLFKLCKVLFLTSERRELIDDVKIQNQDDLDCEKIVGKVDEESLEKARAKVDKFVSKRKPIVSKKESIRKRE